MKKTWKSCFCSLTDGKQYKAFELDTSTQRLIINNAPQSYRTLSVLDMDYCIIFSQMTPQLGPDFQKFTVCFQPIRKV